MIQSMSRNSSRRGTFVVLVGPDGVGKTSVARELIHQFEGCTGYFHFRPPFWSTLDDMPGPEVGPRTVKSRTPENPVIGLARLARSLLSFWAGYLRRIRPAVRRGCLVIGDRWAYGYVLQPRALGYSGPAWLARMALGMMPRPDTLVALQAPSDLVLSRKQELTAEEVLFESEAVRSLRRPQAIVFQSIDPPDVVARRIIQQLGISGPRR